MHALITYIDIDLFTALQVVLLGFIGGILSGFIGSGGAFFMTPGMMNLGVDGVISVASNITHKFGKAMVGSRKHAAAGNVDKKLAAFMLITAVIGIQIAVAINSHLLKGGGGGHGAGGSPGANLYISLVFATILSAVAVSMLRDVLKSGGNGEDGGGPSMKIAEFFSRLNLPPVIYFSVADTKISLWVLMAGGIATGYLAGTIGVGGFIGVPAMIYVFGVPTAVATGTELFDDTILSNLMGGTYDLFVEGSVASYEKSDLLQRIDSKLYRNLPCPVIIARNLIEPRKILVVFDDEVNIGKLLLAMIDLFSGARLRFDLLYCSLLGTGMAVEPIEAAEGLFSKADEILDRHGWVPDNRLALQGTPQGLIKRIEDYSLIVTGLPQGMESNNGLVQLLGDTPSPILLCRQ